MANLPDLPEIEGYLPVATRRPPAAGDLPIRRVLADWMGLFEECPRPACGRARACRARQVFCFDEQRDIVVAVVCGVIFEGYVADE